MMNSKSSWHAPYWIDDKHGSAWDRAKEALHRDWDQTKADFSKTHGKELNQNVGDTLAQAAGTEPIPFPGQPNSAWDEAEPALAYGFGAHKEYGSLYRAWDDTLESRLAKEWDKDKTGKSFDEVKRNVRKGWEYKS